MMVMVMLLLVVMVAIVGIVRSYSCHRFVHFRRCLEAKQSPRSDRDPSCIPIDNFLKMTLFLAEKASNSTLILAFSDAYYCSTMSNN